MTREQAKAIQAHVAEVEGVSAAEIRIAPGRGYQVTIRSAGERARSYVRWTKTWADLTGRAA